MATLQSAKAKYAAKTGPSSSAAAKYNAKKASMPGNYSAGMTRFLGGPINSFISQAYADGIGRAQYNGGDPDKWERGMLSMRS